MSDDTGYFGLCPTCHKTDGYLNVGSSHWFVRRTSDQVVRRREPVQLLAR